MSAMSDVKENMLKLVHLNLRIYFCYSVHGAERERGEL